MFCFFRQKKGNNQLADSRLQIKKEQYLLFTFLFSALVPGNKTPHF